MKSKQQPDAHIVSSTESIPFPDEVTHLKWINQKLVMALQSANNALDNLDRDYMDAKHYMVQSRGDIDPHEMFQNELALKRIDTAGAHAVETRNRLAKLQDSPYFARIDFEKNGHAEPSPHYIGRFAFAPDNDLLIVDWRAPIASLFYDHEVGPAYYIAPQGRMDGRLTRKRQFKIKDGTMAYAIESSDNVQDDVLQKELSQTSDDKMKSIIATIQKEQNAIIRNEKAQTLIIQGVAGSGKTSIALHRIAFLLYRFKERLSAQNVTILSPNKVFGDYIANVLPELGEEPIFEVGLQDIADIQLERVIDYVPSPNPLETSDAAWADRVRLKSSLAFVQLMDTYVADLPRIALDIQPYRYERFSVSAAWIQARLDAYNKHPLLQRLAMIADDIHNRFASENIREEELPKPRTILKSLKGMLRIKSTLALYKDFYRQNGLSMQIVMPDKKTLEWNDVFPFLYLHAAFSGLQSSAIIRHLVIDEMQDYTPIEYAVINRLFPCDKTILGDFGQSINPNHSHTLADLRQLYPGAAFVDLKTSYRSTYEIIQFAKAIYPPADLEAIKRHGPVPKVIQCKAEDDALNTLLQLLRQFQASTHQSLGIIVRTNQIAQSFLSKLPSDLDIHAITPDSDHFAGGISLVSIQMAKGLEFDEVIIADTCDRSYESEYERRLLYVACTRAMHRLTLLHTEEHAPISPS